MTFLNRVSEFRGIVPTEHFNRRSVSSPAFYLWTFLKLMPSDGDCADGIEL
jgi:hypothetical protein